jgi:hypothetical protein
MVITIHRIIHELAAGGYVYFELTTASFSYYFNGVSSFFVK